MAWPAERPSNPCHSAASATHCLANLFAQAVVRQHPERARPGRKHQTWIKHPLSVGRRHVFKTVAAPVRDFILRPRPNHPLRIRRHCQYAVAQAAPGGRSSK